MGWGSITGVNDTWSNWGNWTTVAGTNFNVTAFGATVAHRIEARWQGRTHTSVTSPRSEVRFEVRWLQVGTNGGLNHVDTVNANNTFRVNVTNGDNAASDHRIITRDGTWRQRVTRGFNHNAAGVGTSQTAVGSVNPWGNTNLLGSATQTVNVTTTAPPAVTVRTRSEATNAPTAALSLTSAPTVNIRRGAGEVFHWARVQTRDNASASWNAPEWVPAGNGVTGNISVPWTDAGLRRLILGGQVRYQVWTGQTNASNAIQVGTTYSTAAVTRTPLTRSVLTVTAPSWLSGTGTRTITIHINRQHPLIEHRIDIQQNVGGQWCPRQSFDVTGDGSSTLTLSQQSVDAIRAAITTGNTTSMRAAFSSRVGTGTMANRPMLGTVGHVNFILTLSGANPV